MGQRINLVIISTKPSGPVLMEDGTEIIVSEESAKAVQVVKEGGAPSISYEDIGGIKNEISRVREMIELPLRHPELLRDWVLKPPKGFYSMDLQVRARPYLPKPWRTKLMQTIIQLVDPR